MSDLFERVVDHTDDGLGLLLDQFVNKPRIEAWISAYLKQVQVLEDAAYGVAVSRFLYNATNAQLAVIGKIVGEPNRYDLDDDNYRIFINARILANRSLGSVKEILAIRDLIDDTAFGFDEYFPASMLLTYTAITTRDVTIIASMIRSAKAGGVWLGVVTPTTDATHRFTYMSVGDSSVSTHGYGDYASPTSDGLMSDGVYTPR